MTSSKQKILEIYLEKLALNELPQEREKELLARLEAEPGGKEMLEELEASNQEILAQYPPRLMAVQIEERARRKDAQKARRPGAWLAVPALAAVAAAVAFAWFLTPRQPQDSIIGEKEVIRIKRPDDGVLFVFRKGGAEEEPLKNGAIAKEGDVLQLKYHVNEATHGVIFSVDGRGTVTLHFPSASDMPTTLEHKGSHALGFSYELDDAPGFERFFFVTSMHPLNVNEVLEAGRRLGPNRRDHLELKDDLEQSDFLLLKDNGR